MASKVSPTDAVHFKKPFGVASKKPLKFKGRSKTQKPISAQQKENIIKHLLQQSQSPTFPQSPLEPLSSGSGSLWNAQTLQSLIPRRASFVNFVEVSSHDPVRSINDEIECRTKQMQEVTNTIYFATLQYYCDFLVHLRNRLHVFTTMTKANALRFDTPTNTLTQFSQESLCLIPAANTQAKHLAISFIDCSFQPLSDYIHATIRSSFSAPALSILVRLVSDASSDVSSRITSQS